MTKWQGDKEVKEQINQMSRIEMAYLWRFAPSGHPYFDDRKPFYKVFKKRFMHDLGGFTPEISKAIEKENNLTIEH